MIIISIHWSCIERSWNCSLGTCLGVRRKVPGVAKQSLGQWLHLTGSLICAMLSPALQSNALQPHSFWYQFSLPVSSGYGCRDTPLTDSNQCPGTITLAQIFEVKVRVSLWSWTDSHFSIKKFLEDPSIGHVVDVILIRPAEVALLQQGVKAGDLDVGENHLLCHSILPINAKNVPKIAHVEGVEFSLLSGIDSPGFTAIKQGADNVDTVYHHLCIYC